MLTRAWMEIDLAALVRNANALGHRAGVPVIPMIKADAYGLGAVHAAHALERIEPYAYGVATVAEGVELRDAGIERRVIIFTPILAEDMSDAHSTRLTPTIGSIAELESWKSYGSPYHLSIDTGMARAGIPWRAIESLLPLLNAFPPEGAFTHFHSPQLNDDSMLQQEQRLEHALKLLSDWPSVVHTDGSAAIVRHEASSWNAVRPGIFMYGVGSGESAAIQPECVVTVSARIVELRTVEAGDSVSYDATWTAPSTRSIATIALGYADGYPRGASNAGLGIVRKKIVPIVGRVTMDMIMLDVTDSGVEVGDPVVMIGDGPAFAAPIDLSSVASFAAMSPYELLTGLRGRLTRIYTGLQQ